MHKSPWILKMQLATKWACTNNELPLIPQAFPNLPCNCKIWQLKFQQNHLLQS